MGLKTRLDPFKKGKIFSSVGETNHDSSVIQPVTQSLYRVGCVGCKVHSKNKVTGTSNTSIFIIDRSRRHVSTIIGSSSVLLFEK